MATTGPKSPTAAQTVSETPWSDNTWSNPTYVYLSGQASVTASTFDSGDQTYVLKAYNFDFSSIPAEAVITGIKVIVNARYANGVGTLGLVQLTNESRVKTGQNKALHEVALTTSLADYAFGGDNDTWGLPIDRAMTQDTDFGVAIGFWSRGTDTDVYVDYVTMEVFYAIPDADPAWLTVTDDFNRADGGLGTGWEIFHYSDPSYLVINSNRVTGNVASQYNGCKYVGVAASENHYAMAQYVTGGRFYLAARIVPPDEELWESYDEFDRADANPISDGPWTNWENVYNGLRILSNKACGITSDDWNVATNVVPLNSLDQVAGVLVDTSGQGVELTLREDGSGNCYVLHVEPAATPEALLYRVTDDGTTWTELATVSIGYSAGDYLTFAVSGINSVHLRAFVNSTEILYAVDSAAEKITTGNYSSLAVYGTTTRLDYFSACSLEYCGRFYHLLYDLSDQMFTLRGTIDEMSCNFPIWEKAGYVLSSGDTVALKAVGSFLKVLVNDSQIAAIPIIDNFGLSGGRIGLAAYSTDVRLDNWVGGYVSATIDQTIGVGTLSRSAAMQSVRLALGTTAGVSPFSGYAAFQGSGQQAGSLIPLNGLSGLAEILAAAQSCGATIGINFLTASATVYASTVSSGVSIALNLLAWSTGIQFATVVTLGDVTVVLSVLPGSSLIGSAASSAGATVPAGLLSGEAEILSGSVAIHATFQIDLLQGAASVRSPTTSEGMALALGILQGIPGIRSVSVQVSSTTEITVGILSAEGEVGSPALSAGSMMGLGAFSGVGAVYATSANIGALLEIAMLSGTAAILTVDAALGVISILGVVNGSAAIREVAITTSVQEVANAFEAVGSTFGPDVVIDWDQILNLLQGQGGLNEARASVVVIPASRIYFATRRLRDYEAEKRERDFLATARKRDYYDA